jgi:hypothetical protein
MLLKIFWVIKTLKMGQKSDPETLVLHQKMTPGYNPEDFKQHFEVVTVYAAISFRGSGGTAPLTLISALMEARGQLRPFYPQLQ